MSVATLVRAVEVAQMRDDRPELQSGDTVRVHVKVIEGSRERIQVFEGIVIRLNGDGARRSFTVRRKNLYYMRELRGKAARLKERRD